MSEETWTGLDPDDVRHLLFGLIGYRFGERPEERLDEIRAERQAYAAGFINMLGVGADDTVLELGSGCGFGTAAIARRVQRVIACDISPAYLAFARRECADCENVAFHEIPGHDLSALAPQSVDAVISVSVFIHFNLYDIHAYLRAFAGVLKPRGRVVFDFSDMHRLFGWRRAHGLNELFLEHAGYYREKPATLPRLLQWNSARGIKGVARAAGFKPLRRRGNRLLLQLR